jgi:hypothetical protein
MDTMLVKKLRTMAAGVLMLGAVNHAQAVDFTGTLDLTNTTAYQIQYEFPTGSGNYITALGALDVNRYNLGSALNGVYNILFTPGTFNLQYSMLAFTLSDNPNQAVVDNPGLLAPLASNMGLLGSILQGNSWTVYNVPPNATTNMLDYAVALTLPPLTAGTHYYLFAEGGSIIPASIPYTLTVTAVPEPEVWAMMIAGLLMLFYQQFRRGRQQRLALRST